MGYHSQRKKLAEEEQDQFWTNFKIAVRTGLSLIMVIKRMVLVIMSFKAPTTTT